MDRIYGNDFALDDIVVDTIVPTLATDVGNDVPEPASWPLLATALGASLVAGSRILRSARATRS